MSLLRKAKFSMGRGKEELNEWETEEKVVLKEKLGFGYGGNHFCCGVKARDERSRRLIERTK